MRAPNRCPACGSLGSRPRFGGSGHDPAAVDSHEFRPSAAAFGHIVGDVLRCGACGHGWVARAPSAEAIAVAYEGSADAALLEEEDGQLATAGRDLAWIERHRRLGSLLDVGCWTGSFVVAASARGWDASGIEPSEWAVRRAVERGAAVRMGDLSDLDAEADGSRDLIVMTDVLEHLVEPADAVDHLRCLLVDDGLLFLTMPDAGSLVARVLGRRWWSVLPMHLHYFTRTSMRRLLHRRGFEVLDIRAHPKVLTARYYTERLAEFVPAAGGPLRRLSAAAAFGRPVGPDLRDRMAVLARRIP